jgi:hypothetical protein
MKSYKYLMNSVLEGIDILLWLALQYWGGTPNWWPNFVRFVHCKQFHNIGFAFYLIFRYCRIFQKNTIPVLKHYNWRLQRDSLLSAQNGTSLTPSDQPQCSSMHLVWLFIILLENQQLPIVTHKNNTLKLYT